MNRQEFKEWASSKIRLLDGSTGTALAEMFGMDGSEPTEKFILENPKSIVELQKAYVGAGSDIILTPTLGTNPEQLIAHGFTDIDKVNKTLCSLSKEASGGKAMVAVELGPSGQYMAPMGMKTFDDIVDSYKQQIIPSLETEPDMFILETFIDLSEARAAIIAIRELSDLPIIASMTFENGMSLSGNSPEAVAVTLEAAGADAVGANCSTGPSQVAQVINKMATVTNLPLFAKPNAGMPEVIEGKTCFPMGEDEFANESIKLINAGATLIGGCCGTMPGHIKVLSTKIKDITPAKRVEVTDVFVASPRDVVKLNDDKFIPIGEKINPTGRKKFAADLVAGNIMSAVNIATEQVEAGAKVLDVNVGAAGVDEKALLKQMAQEIPVYCPCPLCFDTSNVEAMEAALRTYCGRAIINSASAESDRMEAMIELAAKYGAVIILLPFTGKADLNCEDRKEGLKKLIDCCDKHGIKQNQVLVDAVVMAVSTNVNSPYDAIDFVKWCTDQGYMTTGGVSNISFGLPKREAINEAFLLQMIKAGLSSGIVNPCIETNNVINVSYLLSGKDEWCMNWIEENR